MSDVVFGRLRALLGTGGVERDAAGLPRATPESADALDLRRNDLAAVACSDQHGRPPGAIRYRL